MVLGIDDAHMLDDASAALLFHLVINGIAFAGAAPTGTAGTLRVHVGGQDATVTTTSATDGAVSATAPETDYSDTGPSAVTVITPQARRHC